jgi:hypothetical protein
MSDPTKPIINTFSEARLASLKLKILRMDAQNIEAALGAFYERVEGGVSQFVGSREETPTPPPQKEDKEEKKETEPELLTEAPETLADRVLKIVRDAGRAMKPKDVAVKYASLGWPPTGGKLYDSISASLGYIHKRKKQLVKTRKGYIPAPVGQNGISHVVLELAQQITT